MASVPIYVTQPSLPPLEEYVGYLEQIWETRRLTNNGPLVRRLEERLQEHLGVRNVVCVSSGTVALELAIRALGLSGEVITTPFSFVATANVIAWQRCRPIFVDIDRATWNLDPSLIEAAITPRTSAILPVHTFSVPCDVERIREIAARRRLPVVYDATHAMNVKLGDRSLLEFGNISCVSFHATKLFSVGEGGACVTNDDELAERVRRMRYFGFDDAMQVVENGTNAKMSELHAAMGLASLDRLATACLTRLQHHERYRRLLSESATVAFQKLDPAQYNYSYFPVLLDSEEAVLGLKGELERHNIFPRRYFSPSLNTIPRFGPCLSMPVAENISARVICLPLYEQLASAEIDRICELFRRVLS